MRLRTTMMFLAVPVLLISLAPLRVYAQSCDPDEAMVQDSVKTIGDLVGQVKKETVDVFEQKYHQRNCLTKLSLFASETDGLIQCLEKAAKDPATPKEQAEADKAKLDSFTKLKNQAQSDRDTLKKINDAKLAKAFVEKLAFTQ
jgi:hypothetical protein